MNALKHLANDLKIDSKMKKKSEIVSDILNSQVPVSVLTPVVRQSAVSEIDTLPKFKKISPGSTRFPTARSIQSSPLLLVLAQKVSWQPTECGSTVKNFKDLDRAVKHYDAAWRCSRYSICKSKIWNSMYNTLYRAYVLYVLIWTKKFYLSFSRLMSLQFMSKQHAMHQWRNFHYQVFVCCTI